MPTGRPDYWYGTALYFDDSPGDGELTRGPTCNWAYDHVNNPTAHGPGYSDADAVDAMGVKDDDNPLNHDKYTNAEAVTQAKGIVQDTPVDGVTDQPISSNWAHDHKADASAHHAKYTDGEAVAQAKGIVQDTPVNGVTDQPISSNWAYDHKADASAHHTKTVSSEIDHGSIQGLSDDDHAQYLRTDGSRASTGTYKINLDEGGFEIQVEGVAKVSWGYHVSTSQPFFIRDVVGSKTLLSVDLDGNLVPLGKVNGVSLSGGLFIDRGTRSSADITSWALDSTWHDLDLSAIVPAGAKAVLLHAYIAASAAGMMVRFRKKGYTTSAECNCSDLWTQVKDIRIYADLVVPCDTDRKIQYWATNAGITELAATIGGWWK